MSQQSTAREEVRAALERTLSRATARIGFHYELCSDWSHLPAGAGIGEHDLP
ncbi:MAG: hypothetical protein M3433_06690 [Actinomycetota bacterium]|nr:hypothetical protein [Actinomycetota bacterium]